MPGDGREPDWPVPVEILNETGGSPFVLTCEHASNHIPRAYCGLGLSKSELCRHIAWDIGAAAVARELAKRLHAPAFLGGYSRLLIDLNRPPEAPDSIPLRSEATEIPGNAGITATERTRRVALIFDPFHRAVAARLDARQAAARPTIIVAIHSFTPVFHGIDRPWHAGVLYEHSRSFGEALRAALAREDGLVIAANQPYAIDRREDYTIPVHGEDRGVPAVLIEIRQDLLTTHDGVAAWAGRLANALETSARAPAQAEMP